MSNPEPTTKASSTGPRYPHVRVRLTGRDGNIYMIMGESPSPYVGRSVTPQPTNSTPPPTNAGPTTRSSSSSCAPSASPNRSHRVTKAGVL